MKTENLIPLNKICAHFEVEMAFFDSLQEVGLLEIRTIEKAHYVPEEAIAPLEKMIRLHHQLELDSEGIDIIFNLLGKIDQLQAEVMALRSRLQWLERSSLEAFHDL